MLLMFVLYAAWIGWTMRDAWTTYPALQDVDRATQTGPLLPALAVLLCANQALLRSQRQDTDRHFDVLVLEPWRRTVAFALSVVPAAVLTALLVAAQFTWGVLAARLGRPRLGRRTPRRTAHGAARRYGRGTAGPGRTVTLRGTDAPGAGVLLDPLPRGGPGWRRRQRHTVAGPGHRRREQQDAPLRPAGPPGRLARPLPVRPRADPGAGSGPGQWRPYEDGGGGTRGGGGGPRHLGRDGPGGPRCPRRRRTPACWRPSTRRRSSPAPGTATPRTARSPSGCPHRNLGEGRRQCPVPGRRHRRPGEAPRTAARRGPLRHGRRRRDRTVHRALPGDRRHALGRPPGTGVRRGGLPPCWSWAARRRPARSATAAWSPSCGWRSAGSPTR
ncbi:hypothetical protein ACRAWF_26390 [Streptomyces sp. L7]